MSVRRARRYYLLKRLSATREDSGLASAWRGLQEREPGTSLPASFPGRESLVAAGYTTIEDVDGADVSELLSNVPGLGRRDAEAALAAV